MILFYSTEYNQVINVVTEEAPRSNSPLKIAIFCVLIAILLIYCFICDYREKVKKGRAYAKINLYLNILNKRKDGYHNLKSIFDFINLYDDITVRKANCFKLICNDKSLENEDNIIYKTYLLLKAKYPIIKGVKVTLEKRIPKEAGLAGGSSDAATFIDLVRQLYDLNISEPEIKELTSKIGADVLPCYYQKTSLVSGFGNEVEIIKNNLKYYLVVIKPNLNCSTKEMYQLLDKKKRTERKTINQLMSALEKGSVKGVAKYLYNDFEKVVDIKEIKEHLIVCGALNALMSGSGSSVFGIFDSYHNAQNAYDELKDLYECYICENIKVD